MAPDTGGNMSKGWDSALDAMTGLAHAFKTPEYQKHLTGFAASLAKAGKMFNIETGERIDATATPADRQRISQLIAGAVSNIQLAEPVWVSGDVVDLVEYAADAPSFKPEPIYLDHLFVPHAFCLFERPITTDDVKGLKMSYRALSWSTTQVAPDNPAERGLLICAWSHRDDPDGYYDPATETVTLDGKAHPSGKMPLLGGSPYTLAHVDNLPFGEDRFLVEPIIARMVAQYESLWRLARQKIVVHAPERTSRPTWKRASNWRQIKEVTVLRLRRTEYKTDYEGEPGGSELSYRTNVRGYWRDTYYATLGPVGDPNAYRQQWIDEYIRGPEDKPLILKKHAVEFTR